MNECPSTEKAVPRSAKLKGKTRNQIQIRITWVLLARGLKREGRQSAMARGPAEQLRKRRRRKCQKKSSRIVKLVRNEKILKKQREKARKGAKKRNRRIKERRKKRRTYHRKHQPVESISLLRPLRAAPVVVFESGLKQPRQIGFETNRALTGFL